MVTAKPSSSPITMAVAADRITNLPNSKMPEWPSVGLETRQVAKWLWAPAKPRLQKFART